jgi:biotin carboxylase
MVASGADRRADGPDGLTRPPVLVVLGGGPAQRHAIDAAAQLGVRTVVLDADPRLADAPVSSEDTDGVRRVAREVGAAGLIAPGTDWPVRIGAYVAEDLDLPHPISVATAVVATNKIAQRARLDEAGVPQPAWSGERPPTFPCVVKPSDRQGQRGLSFVSDETRLEGAERRARAASRSGRVIYEERVRGPEVTVNAFSAGGRFMPVAVTDRDHFPQAPGVAHRHVYPSARGAGEAAAAAGQAAAALGIADGPSYAQLILAEDGPRVIEVAARLGGGHDSELCRTAVGIDLAAAAVQAALGRPVDPAALVPEPRSAAVIEFLAAPPGRLLRAEGPPDVVFYHQPGHIYEPLLTGPDRAGYVLALGSDRDAALAAARRAVASVTFVTV